MFSCSKENIETPTDAPGEKANLTVTVTGEGNLKSGSKAPGAVVGDAVVNNYIVFLFRDNGMIDCAPQHSATGAKLTITAGTTAAKTAYVVANTGAVAGGLFAAVKTENDLKAVVGDLMSGPNTASQTGTNLWMSSGASTITYGTGVDANKGAVTAALAFVGAKIELVVKDERTNMTGGNTTIKDDAVVLLFAGKEGKFFETLPNQVAQTSFYSGDVTYDNPTASTLSTALYDKVVTPFTANATATVFNHFYTFGNDATKTPTILAIQSTKTVAGVDETIYYPVQFTLGDAGHVIEPGKSYTVNVTLKGDVNTGGGGGTVDPEDPFITADIEVTVTPATWTALIIDKEFN